MAGSIKMTEEQGRRMLDILIERGWYVSPTRAIEWLRDRGLDTDDRSVLSTQINLATFDWLTVRCASCGLCRGDVTVPPNRHKCATPTWHSADAIAGLGLAAVLGGG